MEGSLGGCYRVGGGAGGRRLISIPPSHSPLVCAVASVWVSGGLVALFLCYSCQGAPASHGLSLAFWLCK